MDILQLVIYHNKQVLKKSVFKKLPGVAASREGMGDKGVSVGERFFYRLLFYMGLIFQNQDNIFIY